MISCEESFTILYTVVLLYDTICNTQKERERHTHSKLIGVPEPEGCFEILFTQKTLRSN